MIGSILQAGVGVAQAIGAGRDKRRAEQERQAAMAEMNRQKAAFAGLDTSNPFMNMENTMEDLTVNQQQAQFEAQQGQQQRANIMSQMRGAAGASGVAALAQQMAQSGQLQAQQASASIGQQEAANQMAAAQQAAALQNQERQGDVMSRNWERDKTSTLLGMSQSEVAGARERVAGAEAAKWEGIGGAAAGIGGIADSFFGGF